MFLTPARRSRRATLRATPQPVSFAITGTGDPGRAAGTGLGTAAKSRSPSGCTSS
jgi:hypothetical protein